MNDDRNKTRADGGREEGGIRPEEEERTEEGTGEQGDAPDRPTVQRREFHGPLRSFMGATRPSEVLLAMCDGLEDSLKDPGFFVDMATFGRAEGDACFGCAATCALQKLSGVRFDADNIGHLRDRLSALPLGSVGDVKDLMVFEGTVDDARRGKVRRLFEFFGLPARLSDRYADRWWLGRRTWRAQLPKVREAAEEMAAEGF